MSVARKNPQRCPAVRKDGRPCTSAAGPSGFCIGHSPTAQDARCRGGVGSSRAARAGKLLRARLRPVADLLDKALTETHDGQLDPRVATAMASLAGAMIRVLTSGELEERVRALEERDQ